MSRLDHLTDDDWIGMELRIIRLEEIAKGLMVWAEEATDRVNAMRIALLLLKDQLK